MLLFESFSIAQTKQKSAPAGPSLDRLVTRVSEYWNLLSLRNKVKAASYIVPSDRNKFFSSVTQPFRAPQLKSLDLSDDRNRVTVTVMVKRVVPPVTTEVDFPVKDHWLFQGGNWYRQFNNQMPLPGFSDAKRLSPEQIEAVKIELRQKLRFQKTNFDFGTVKQGEDVVLTVKYSLAGTEPLLLSFRSTAPGAECASCDRERGMSLRGPKDQQLLPGKQQELSVEVPTWAYGGDVKEQFTLATKFKGMEIPFEFTAQGNVYVPLWITPRELRFTKGERSKGIVIRNNSKSDIQLEKVISESGAITIDPFPVSLRPGEQRTLEVRAEERIDTVFPNSVDRVAITYTPVDGFSSLSYKVYLNAHEVQPETPNLPFNDSQIQELIRRNPVTLPTR